MPRNDNSNISEIFFETMKSRPDTVALRIPASWTDTAVTRYESATYKEMGQRIAAYQGGLEKAGFRRGDRILIMLQPGIDFYCLFYALMASGMVPVLIDPGMGLRRFMTGIKDSRATAVIGTRRLFTLRFLMPAMWGLKWYGADKTGIGVKPLDALKDPSNAMIQIHRCDADDHGLITFTSGSTGRPKGADRTHRLLIEQFRNLKKCLPHNDDMIDMTCFPVLALHFFSGGVPTTLCAVDLKAVAKTHPERIIDQIQSLGVKRLTAPPSFMKILAEHIIARGADVSSIIELAVGGAPVSRELCLLMKNAFPGASGKILYGSTEAEPISSILIDEVISAEGDGYLVGRPHDFTEVMIAGLPEEPDAIVDTTLRSYRVAPGGIGEIVVKGAHVLKGYIDNPEADRENKVHCPDGTVWHRTGDTGYFDENGRLWLTGRTKDIVEFNNQSIQPLVLERMLNAVAGIRQSAIVSLNGRKTPVIALEIQPGASPDRTMEKVKIHLMEKNLHAIPTRIVRTIPVDGRHNSKTDRVLLRKQLSAYKAWCR